MIHVDNGYVLSEAPTQTNVFRDSAVAAGHIMRIPKTEKALDVRNNPTTVYTTTTGYKIYSWGGSSYVLAAKIIGAGPIIIDTLRFAWGSGYCYGTAIAKFKWWAEAVPDAVGWYMWHWYRSHSYDNGATWSAPIEDTTYVSPSDDPNVLTNYLVFAGSYSRNFCLYYGGQYYPVLTYPGILFPYTQPGSSFAADEELGTSEFGVLIQYDNKNCNDYIHTVSGIVTG